MLKITGVSQEAGDNVINGFAALPIGSVVDWWRPNASFAVPSEFREADGSAVSDSDSPFNGFNLPNLVNRFIQSTTAAGNIGNTGGADSIDLTHQHNGTTHSHQAPHTHSVSGGPGGPHTSTGDNASDNLVNLPGHTHGALTSSSQNTTTTTNGTTNFNSSSNSVNKIPGHVGVLKLVKIKTTLKVTQGTNLTPNVIDKSVGIPVGGVIPWWTDKTSPAGFPPNMQICDGGAVTAPHSIFFGLNTPDLRNRFARGVDPVNINLVSGSDTESWNHTHTFTCPGHSLNHNHSGSVATNPGDIRTEGSGGALGVTPHAHTYTTNLTNVSFSALNSTTTATQPVISVIPPYFNMIYLVRTF